MIESIKKLLEETGCTTEKAEMIGNQIAAVIGRATVPKKEFNTKTVLVKRLQKQLQEKELEVEHLKQNVDLVNTLKKQLAMTQDKHDIETNELKSHLEMLVFNQALALEFLEAGTKHAKAAKGSIDSEI